MRVGVFSKIANTALLGLIMLGPLHWGSAHERWTTIACNWWAIAAFCAALFVAAGLGAYGH